jgi:hypothetical protein
MRDFPFIIAAYDWDVFEPGWPESAWTQLPSAGLVGSATYYAEPRDPDFGDPINLTAPVIANQRARFPATLLPRQGGYSHGETKWWWLGRLANESQVAPGNYTYAIPLLHAAGPFTLPGVSSRFDNTADAVVHEHTGFKFRDYRVLGCLGSIV